MNSWQGLVGIWALSTITSLKWIQPKPLIDHCKEKEFHVLSNPEASYELVRDYAKMACVHSAMVVSKECLLVYGIRVRSHFDHKVLS